MIVNWKVVVAILLTVGSVALAAAEARWSVPKLHELGGEDQIQRHNTVLSPAELTEIRKITSKMRAKCHEEPAEEEGAENLFRTLRVQKAQLGDNGQQGIIVQFSADCACGVSGNCTFWILDPESARVLLSGIMQTFEVQGSSSNGYSDLILGMHDSAAETYLQRYSFDGKRYRRTGCAKMLYTPANQPLRFLKVPRITPQGCVSAR